MTERVISAAAPRPHVDYVFVSPCQSEQKNQDRARVAREGDAILAVVCDGVTHSMFGGDAAEIVFSDPVSLWSPNSGVAPFVERLHTARATLIAGGEGDEPPGDSYLSRAFARIRAEASLSSYQTTLVTARLTVRGRALVLESKTCGDSALFAFDSVGRLLHSNRNLDNVEWGFGHLSSTTEVLPDHFRGELSVVQVELPATAHVVLCSDGFYDAFDSPSSLFRWLLLHSEHLAASRTEAFDALHAQLDRRTGDDDISVVWLCPSIDEQPLDERPRPLSAPAGAHPQKSPSIFRRLFRIDRQAKGGVSR